MAAGMKLILASSCRPVNQPEPIPWRT
jgi:hypothetical protein